MIDFENVSKAFKRVPVLESVSLGIARGDRVALVGSNGAGKTTLIRCLLGEYVCRGSVTVDGMAPRAHRRRVLERIGFVPQLPPPLRMPVGELLHFAAGACGVDPAPMEAVARRLELDVDEVRRRPFVKLSGGQKQKLLIGIALGRDCGILVMDEPAANLDPVSRRAFFGLLAELPGETVMLISSHRLDEVAPLVNRVIEMDRGRVVLDDRVADAVDMTGTMDCTIEMTRPEEALARALTEWRFQDQGGGLIWRGTVAGPDRLRFLGMISRYAGLLAGITMKEVPDGGGTAP